MRYGIPTLALLLLGPGCGGEPGVPRAELDALLQRLDAMDRRLDALEEALPEQPAGEDLPAAPADPFARAPAVAEAVVAEAAAPTVAVRITAAGVEIDGKAVAREDVLARLREIATLQPRTRLTLVSEPDAPYDAVVRTIDLAREAGLTDVAMSVRVHGEGEGAAGP